jgi:hypothetical protein
MDFKQWLTEVKGAKPELAEFITKLEPFISENGFNTTKFEKAVSEGLKKIETELPNSAK